MRPFFIEVHHEAHEEHEEKEYSPQKMETRRLDLPRFRVMMWMIK
jgi:hypothetical protein